MCCTWCQLIHYVMILSHYDTIGMNVGLISVDRSWMEDVSSCLEMYYRCPDDYRCVLMIAYELQNLAQGLVQLQKDGQGLELLEGEEN